MTIPFKRRLLDQIELNDHEKKNLQILDTIRKKGPIARAEISRLIGLNIVTVTSYVDQYIKKGVIKEVGVDVSSGGRKPTLVDLDSFSVYLIGVGLNHMEIVCVLSDLKGNVVQKAHFPRTPKASEELIKDIVAAIESLIKTSKVDLSKLHGIGIGLPGIFNRENNSIRWPVGLLSGDLALMASVNRIFEDKFNVPTIIDNDANVAVFGEEWYAGGLGVQHAVFLYSGNGIGLMVNGQIYRGANGCAGEWLFDENPLPALVQAYNAGLWHLDMGIALQAQEIYPEKKDSKIYSSVGGDLKKVTFHTVIKAAEEGDPLAKELIRLAGERLGRKAAHLVNLFNPEVLVVGGGVEAAGIYFLDTVRDTIKKICIPEATDKLKIVPSKLGEDGVALGAAALVAQNYFVSV